MQACEAVCRGEGRPRGYRLVRSGVNSLEEAAGYLRGPILLCTSRSVPVLTICNHKGGTGKTTSSIHLAAAFGHAGRRVLVVDLDPQGFLTRMVGGREPAPEHSALALVDPHGDFRTVPVQHMSGFDLVGSSMALTRALRKLTKPTDVLWLRETVAAGHDYDLILFDTAAALSVFTMNALVASDHVIVPVTPEYQPVVGAEQTWNTAALVKSKLNPVLQPPRMLLTQVDARLSRHSKYSAYLRSKYGTSVLDTEIRTSSSLAVASRDGRTVFDARVSTRGAEDYAAAAREISGTVFGEDVHTATPPNALVAAPDELKASRPAMEDADPAVAAALRRETAPHVTDLAGTLGTKATLPDLDAPPATSDGDGSSTPISWTSLDQF
ncbi:MAG: ParA family protein [Bacteroidota bacterium]